LLRDLVPYSNGFIRQAAIARGAALRGLAGTAPSLKKQRRHYGYEVGRPFVVGVDDGSKAWDDPFMEGSDKRRITEMDWKIAKVRPTALR